MRTDWLNEARLEIDETMRKAAACCDACAIHGGPCESEENKDLESKSLTDLAKLRMKAGYAKSIRQLRRGEKEA